MKDSTPHLICTITISTKKGEQQITRWLIEQDAPIPHINLTGGLCAGWENAGGLIGRYGNKPEGIGTSYRCHLLAEGVTPPKNWNRTHLAGFKHQPGGYNTQEVTNPGTIVYRGRDMGELEIMIDPFRGFGYNFCNKGMTRTGHDMLMEQVVPHLEGFITEHQATLKAAAVATIHERLESEIVEAEQKIATLKASIPDLITNA